MVTSFLLPVFLILSFIECAELLHTRICARPYHCSSHALRTLSLSSSSSSTFAEFMKTSTTSSHSITSTPEFPKVSAPVTVPVVPTPTLEQDPMPTPTRPAVLAETPTVRVKRLLVGDGDDDVNSKPPFLFLPGLDGIGNYSSTSLKELKDHFDVYSMEISPKDRTGFLDLASIVLQALAKLDRPAILCGESFGGLLATYVASRRPTSLPKLVDKLILVNPATSFEESPINWNVVGDALTRTGPLFPVAGLATLLATAVEPAQFVNIGRNLMSKIDSPESAARVFNDVVSSGDALTKVLSPATLKWRLDKWLSRGVFYMDKDRFEAITAPVLVIIGKNDRLIPSGAEGKRLKQLMKNASSFEIVSVEDGGHALLGGELDFPKLLLESHAFKSLEGLATHSELDDSGNKKSPLDVPFPSKEDIEDIRKRLDPFFKAFSPIFLSRTQGQSTGNDMSDSIGGRITKGLSNVPTGASSGRPVLLVGNHQLYGGDLGFLVHQFLLEKDALIRGLAHPAIFRNNRITNERRIRIFDDNDDDDDDDNDEDDIENKEGSTGGIDNKNKVKKSGNGNTKSKKMSQNGNNSLGRFGGRSDQDELFNVFQRFGAVEVGPGNFMELLKRNETILLFPGGVQEAYHGKDQDYKLFWPEKQDFVRMAATFDAIIVPFAAVGMADSAQIVLDAKEILSLPILGDIAKRSADSVPQARPGGNETFLAPVVVPKLPSRNYFLFQEPFDTRSLKSKADCKRAYVEIRNKVEEGISTLLTLRNSDPYVDFVPRYAYETLTGKQAPTAPLNVVS